MVLHPKGSYRVVPFLFLLTTGPVLQVPKWITLVKVNVVLRGNTDKQIQQCKYQDTKSLPLHLLLEEVFWIPY